MQRPQVEQDPRRDPIDSEIAPLFNPRLQRWRDHFCWSADTRLILGLTPTGRATVVALSSIAPYSSHTAF